MNNYTFENESDEEDDTLGEDVIYEPDEPTITKYNIVICQKYNELMHGVSDYEMNYHFLTIVRFKKLDMNIINLNLVEIPPNVIYKLDIAECIYLPSYHCISIIKTIWLKLIQRNWKRIVKERKLCILRRCNLNVINHREVFGKWPNDCLHYPSLRGMLFNLA